MAVFRVEKTRDFTVMSNHHLRSKALSLKAKGLLSLMLSLPEGWDYTLAGLAHICLEGVSSICAAINELEAAGYLRRRRLRNGKGQLTDTEYTILERPDPPARSLCAKTAHWPNRLYAVFQHWRTQHWVSLRWVSLHWEIAHN